MLTVQDIVDELENIAPPDLADEGDKIGLQVGALSAQVQKICVAVDTSPSVINSAIENKAELLVTHHPLIFHPLRSVTVSDPVARRVIKLVQSGTAHFAMHTNYDTVPGGINDVLAAKLGVVACEPLTTRHTDSLHKIVVFVPEEAVEQVRNAMADAGAGVIGQYTHCSFRSQGIGSFVPLPTAHPYIGSAGKLEEVEEYRLEMVCMGSWVDYVVAAMLEAHPYDEVAYDVYKLANEPVKYGYGRVGKLEEPMSLHDYSERIKDALELDYVKVSGDKDKTIERVAFCGGSGSSLYKEAASTGADVYITGDTKHHDILDADALGLAIIDATHFATEKPGMVALAEKLKKMFAPSGVQVQYIE